MSLVTCVYHTVAELITSPLVRSTFHNLCQFSALLVPLQLTLAVKVKVKGIEQMQCCWNLVVQTRVDQSWAQQTQRVPKLPPFLLPMAQNYGEMDACHHHDFGSRTVALAYIDFGPCMRESRCPRMENSIKNQDS